MGTNAKQPVILLSRTDRLGDLLLSFPAIYRVRELYPEARIIVLIRRYTADLLYAQSFIDRIICLEDYPYPELIREIRSENLDYFIALFSNSMVCKLARNSGARHRIGPLSKLASWFSYNQGIRQKRSRAKQNEALYNLDLLKNLPNYSLPEKLYTKLFYADANKEMAWDFLLKSGLKPESKLVLINPFSGNSAKNLSLEQYLALAKFILDAIPESHIVYSVVPSDPYEPITKVLGQRQSLFISTGSILNLIALIDQAHLYIGASTGPTHIAAFLNKAVVAIYPRILNQSPIRWGLLGSNSVSYIQPEVPCPQKFGCKHSCPHYNCFHSIDIKQVSAVCCGYLV